MNLRPVRSKVVASLDGYKTSLPIFPDPEMTDHVAITLSRPSCLSGAAITEAEVTICQDEDRIIVRSDERGEFFAWGLSNGPAHATIRAPVRADGSFRIDRVRPGIVSIRLLDASERRLDVSEGELRKIAF